MAGDPLNPEAAYDAVSAPIAKIEPGQDESHFTRRATAVEGGHSQTRNHARKSFFLRAYAENPKCACCAHTTELFSSRNSLFRVTCLPPQSCNI